MLSYYIWALLLVTCVSVASLEGAFGFQHLHAPDSFAVSDTRLEPEIRDVNVTYRPLATNNHKERPYYIRYPLHSAPWREKDQSATHRKASWKQGGKDNDLRSVAAGGREGHRSLQELSTQGTAQPIRIHTDVQFHDDTTESARSLVLERILPQVTVRIGGLLKVARPSGSRLAIDRFCTSVLNWSDGTVECADVAPLGRCGPAIERGEYFGDYTTCTGNFVGDCVVNSGNSGSGEAAGLEDTDFILYVTTDPTGCGSDLIGTGAFCDLDPTTFRPLTGFLNFCPGKLQAPSGASADSSPGELDLSSLISTGIHEAFHGLFFHDELYGHYIDKGVFDVSSGTFQKLGIERVLSTGVSVRNKTVQMISTPEVVRHARLLTGCDALQGAEIENEGGDGTMNSHWDRFVSLRRRS